MGAFGAAEAGATDLIIQVGRNAALNENHDPLHGIQLPELWVSAGAGFVLTGAFAGLTTPAMPAPPVAPLTRAEAEDAAALIAKGHAWTKHGRADWEFLWINSREEFVEYVASVLEHPSAVRRLDEFHTAYWDEVRETLVIRDMRTVHGGTAFQPSDGRTYFEKVVQ